MHIKMRILMCITEKYTFVLCIINKKIDNIKENRKRISTMLYKHNNFVITNSTFLNLWCLFLSMLKTKKNENVSNNFCTVNEQFYFCIEYNIFTAIIPYSVLPLHNWWCDFHKLYVLMHTTEHIFFL